MRSNQGIGSAGHQRVGEVSHILLYLAFSQSFRQSFLIYQQVSGKVQENHTVFHLSDLIFSDHIPGTVHKRHMNGNIVTITVDHIHIIDMMDAPRQTPGCIYRDKGVIAVNLHAQVHRRISHPDSNGPKADDSQLLSADLTAGKFFLLLLCFLCNILRSLLLLQPFDTAYDISGGQEHTCDDHFLYPVGVCTGSIENNHSFFGKVLQGNIVHPCTCPCHCHSFIGNLQAVHISASYQNSVCLCKILRFLIFSRKFSQSHR